MFTHDSILNIEIDLIDTCNLICPMCSRNDMMTRDNLKGVQRSLPVDEVIAILDRFTNLKNISFVGSRSESTLYNEYYTLLKYLKSRNVDIVISTNGGTNNTEWWRELGSYLTDRDEIRFAIDGSTQQVYERYRRGGNLQKVLDNHNAFKSNTNCKSILQFIIFKYNIHQLPKMKQLQMDNNFDDILYMHAGYMLDGRQSASIDSYVKKNFDIVDFEPIQKLVDMYKLIESAFVKSKRGTISCVAKETDSMFINHAGDYSICCFHNGDLLRHRKPGEDQNMEFVNREHDEKVSKGDYNFCYTTCNKMCVKLLDSVSVVDGVSGQF